MSRFIFTLLLGCMLGGAASLDAARAGDVNQCIDQRDYPFTAGSIQGVRPAAPSPTVGLDCTAIQSCR